MTKHQLEKHPEYVDGCFGCKITTVAMFGPPGGTRKTSMYRANSRKISRDIDAYKAAKDNGLQPETSTVEGVEKAERQAEVEARITKAFGVNSIKEIVPE